MNPGSQTGKPRSQRPGAATPRETQANSPGLHGRRRGKKLGAHHASLLRTVLPCLSFDASRPIPDPACLFPDRPSALWLEIGFGGGEHLAAQAHAHPDIGYIGCEAFLNGIAKALALIEAGPLRNVRLYYGDARAVIEALPRAALDGAYLLYPDPWPKRRHHRRRFLSDETLDEARARHASGRGASLRYRYRRQRGLELGACLALARFCLGAGGRQGLANALGRMDRHEIRSESAPQRAKACLSHFPSQITLVRSNRNRITFRSVYFARLLSRYSRK